MWAEKHHVKRHALPFLLAYCPSFHRPSFHAHVLTCHLRQGCRHVELDCWDGPQQRYPIITHGHTICTVIRFEEAVKAIAETAFVASQLPLILSLEMHCRRKGQAMVAAALRAHFGAKLLLYEEIDEMAPDDLTPLALQAGPPTPEP